MFLSCGVVLKCAPLCFMQYNSYINYTTPRFCLWIRLLRYERQPCHHQLLFDNSLFTQVWPAHSLKIHTIHRNYSAFTETHTHIFIIVMQRYGIHTLHPPAQLTKWAHLQLFDTVNPSCQKYNDCCHNLPCPHMGFSWRCYVPCSLMAVFKWQ